MPDADKRHTVSYEGRRHDVSRHPSRKLEMTIAEYNNQVRRWRDEAKAAHGYTNKELAKAAFTTESAITHKRTLYRLPFFVVMKIKELSENG